MRQFFITETGERDLDYNVDKSTTNISERLRGIRS